MSFPLYEFSRIKISPTPWSSLVSFQFNKLLALQTILSTFTDYLLSLYTFNLVLRNTYAWNIGDKTSIFVLYLLLLFLGIYVAFIYLWDLYKLIGPNPKEWEPESNGTDATFTEVIRTLFLIFDNVSYSNPTRNNIIKLFTAWMICYIN